LSAACDILVLTEHYLPERGGHVIWLHELCRRLPGSRVLTAKADQLPDAQTIDGVDVRRIDLARRALLRPESLAMYVNMALHAAATVMRERPRVILAARVLPEGVVANGVGRLLRVPVVVFAHGEEINRLRHGRPLPKRRCWTIAAKRRCLWRTYHRATRIIANSRFTHGLLVDGGIDADKVALIHPGTDPEHFLPGPKDPSLAKRWQLRGKKVILTLARLRKRKGQDMTLRAMPRILAAVPDAVYVIAGAGPHEGRLRELANQLNIGEHVRFVGEVSPESMPVLYNLADVFVMPNRVLGESSDVEGFGIVFLEAGAAELPVIGGRSGGVPDAVADGRTGLLVDGESPDEIADAVTSVLGDPALARRLGQAGRRRVCGELTWQHSADRVAELIARMSRRAPADPTAR